MNQEDVLFIAEVAKLATHPIGAKRLSTDKALIDRMVEIRRKYSRQQFDELVKQAKEV